MENRGLLISIPAFYKAFGDAGTTTTELIGIMKWACTKAQEILLKLMIESPLPEPVLQVPGSMPDADDWKNVRELEIW